MAHDGTRKAVLSRADGVVFVADSQSSQSVNNAESFQNLADNAARVGLDFKKLPLVVQFNKRDLDHIVSEEEIMKRWGSTPWPVLFSSALSGNGVMETFETLLVSLYKDMESRFELHSRHGVREAAFIEAVMASNSPG